MGRGQGAGGGGGGRARLGGGAGSIDVEGGRQQVVRENVEIGGQTFRFTTRTDGQGNLYVNVRDKNWKPVANTYQIAKPGGQLHSNWVNVKEQYRRRGIASRMYSTAERLTGRKYSGAATQTEMGKALSKAYRSRKDKE